MDTFGNSSFWLSLGLKTLYFAFGFMLICMPRLLKRSDISWLVGGSLVAGLFALCPGKHERNYVFLEHMSAYPYAFLGACVLVTWVYKRNEVALRMSEPALYLTTLTFIYMLAPWNLFSQVVAALGVAPALAIVWCCFATVNVGKRLQLLFSAWALFVTSLFAITQVWESGELFAPELLDLSTNGILEHGVGTVFYSSGLVFIFFNLLPFFDFFKNKHESAEHYHQRIENDALPFLRARVLSSDFPRRVILFMTLLHGLPLALNWYFRFAPHQMVLAYALVLSPAVTMWLTTLVFGPPPAQPQEVVTNPEVPMRSVANDW